MIAVTGSLHSEFLDYATLILGRPTSNSITVNVLAKSKMEFYIEYGNKKDVYPNKTEIYNTIYPEPAEFIIKDLQPNARYYYRVLFREDSKQEYSTSKEFFFNTQRSKGSTFSFTIQADPHLYDKKGSWGLMAVNMKNQAKDSADFILDLGDTFGDDHNPFTITDEEVKKLHMNYLPFFGLLCHSSPLFLCLGNHEGESGYYLLQTPPNNLAVYETKWRQKFYPNPFPDGFYTGNDEEEPYGIGKPENYYAWEWGDALFVVMDVYRYYTTSEKPKGWEWTIGEKQYNWFKTTLENSQAKYKFVFAHHPLGQGRGGICDAVLYEWGGWTDAKKNNWGFDKNRPGWAKPIQQLMADNKVNIFFQGHDHLFAKEELDGVVYQEVPIPCDSTYEIGYLANADAYTGLTLDGAGYLRVTVSDNDIKVDYVKSYLPKDETDSLKNYMIGYSYNLKSGPNKVMDSVNTLNQDFYLYPNPANDFVKISNSQSAALFNIYGEKLMELSPGSTERIIDISHYASGIYFIKSGNGLKSLIKK